MPVERADRSGWRRPLGSPGRWELLVPLLRNCTQGEIFEALLKESFIRVSPAEDVETEWEYQITLAGEKPSVIQPRSHRVSEIFHEGYRTKVMRPR